MNLLTTEELLETAYANLNRLRLCREVSYAQNTFIGWLLANLATFLIGFAKWHIAKLERKINVRK